MGTPRTVVPRRLAGAGVLVATAGAVALHLSLVAVIGLVLLGTIAVMPSVRRSAAWSTDALAWLPIGACATAAGAVLVVVASGVVRVPLWTPDRATATLIGLAVLIGIASIVRGGRVALWSPASALAWAPAVAVGVAVTSRFLHPMSYWSRPAWALTDWINNGEMTVDLWKNGLLEYASASQSAGGPVSVYPRGLHAVLAWFISGATSTDTIGGAWEATITALFAVTAMMTILVIAAAGLLAITVAQRLPSPRWVVVASPLVTAVLFLHPDIYAAVAVSGFVTTTAATVVLFAVALTVARGPDDGPFTFRVALVAVLTALVFHLWQLLLLPCAAVLVYLLWRWWRAGRRRPLATSIVVVGSAASCLPLGLVTVSGSGSEQASIPANLQAMPLALSLVLVAVPLVGLLLSRMRRTPLAVALVAIGVVLVLLGLGLGLALGGFADGVPYYPAKVLWHASVLLLPATVAVLLWGVTRAWAAAGAVGPSARIARTVLVVVPVVLALAVVGGRVSAGVTSTLSAMAGPQGPTPQVPMAVLDAAEVRHGTAVLPYLLNPQGWQVWLRYDDWHAAQLLRTAGAVVPDGQALLGRRVNAVCDWLRAHPDAVRLTGPRRGDAELVRRGCPADVVRPDAWTVIVTPKDWWADTDWAATGGAPDPSITSPDALLDSVREG